MAWHLEKIWYAKFFQTSTSNFSKFQTPNEKVFNIKLVPLYITFPKSSNSFILDFKCIGCAWLKQDDIIWHGSIFKWQCTCTLQSNPSSKHLIIHLDFQTIIPWAYARPCTMLSSFFPKLESEKSVQISHGFGYIYNCICSENRHTSRQLWISIENPSL
jgi:hypothetical protein